MDERRRADESNRIFFAKSIFYSKDSNFPGTPAPPTNEQGFAARTRRAGVAKNADANPL